MLSECCTQAITVGKLPYNPVSGVKLGKIPKPKIRALGKDEQAALERTVEASMKKTALGITIDLYTGLRLGELLGLRWFFVELNAKRPYISVEWPLTRQEANAPLDDGAIIIRHKEKYDTRSF